MQMDWPTLSAIGGAAGVILAAVWKKLSVSIKWVYTEVTARIDACETDRKELRSDLDEMKSDVDLFKSCGTEPCGAKTAFLRREQFPVKGPKSTPLPP